PGGEVRPDGGDHHAGAGDRLGREAVAEDIRGEQHLGRAGQPLARRAAVDGADVVAALRGERHDVAADAAGGAEDGDGHGRGRHVVSLQDWTFQYNPEASSKWTVQYRPSWPSCLVASMPSAAAVNVQPGRVVPLAGRPAPGGCGSEPVPGGSLPHPPAGKGGRDGANVG